MILWIPTRAPGLNELLNAKGSNWPAYNELKKKWSGMVLILARVQGFRRVEAGHFTYLLVEPNKKRDPSNIVSGAVKVVEDALVDAGLLENDGWEHVLGLKGHWIQRTGLTGVLLCWDGDRTLSLDEMIEHLMKVESNERIKENGHRAANGRDSKLSAQIRATAHESSKAPRVPVYPERVAGRARERAKGARADGRTGIRVKR